MQCGDYWVGVSEIISRKGLWKNSIFIAGKYDFVNEPG